MPEEKDGSYKEGYSHGYDVGVEDGENSRQPRIDELEEQINALRECLDNIRDSARDALA